MDLGRSVARPPLVVAGIGAALFLVAAAHHGRELLVLNRGVGPLAAFLLDGLPALAVVYAGHRLSRTDLSPAAQRTVCRWCLAGILLFVAVMAATFSIRVLEGRTIAEPLFPLLIAADAGGLAGYTAGYYNARARRDAERAETASEQLSSLNRRLEASNERLEQFASAASHDLQEPLRMVLNYLRLLEREHADRLDEEAEEYVEHAVDGAERMRETIESLLEYARVETEGGPLEPVDLDAVVEDVLADLRVRIEKRDAEVTVEDLPRVRGDGRQLRLVVQNLLDNAIEYSGDDPPRVHVSAERDGEEWVVSVEDEGVGIDRERADRVFEAFERLQAADDHAGTGIGLATCERIVERHGGDIWVESEPGEGSTFSFTLQAVDER